MEIFYQTKYGVYPYHRKMGEEKTFVEHLHPYSSKQMAARVKQFSRIFKTIHCPHIIPLFRILKEENQFHMIYEYHDRSLNDYLPKHLHSEIKRIEQEISCALKCLQEAKVRVDIRIENVVVTDEGKIKLFVMPDAEDPLNQQDLQQFYTTEKTRLHFQMQELWEQVKGPDDDEAEKEQNSPGFIISGNKIVFIKNPIHGKVVSKQMTNQIREGVHGHHSHDLPKNILGSLYQPKETSDNVKPKRSSPNQNIADTKYSEKLTQKHNSPSVKDTDLSDDRQKQSGLSKANSSNEDLNLMKKHPQRSSAGNVNLFKPIEEKMSSSANPKSNEHSQYTQQRPVSSYQNEKIQESHHEVSHGSMKEHQTSHQSSEHNKTGNSEREKKRYSEQDKIQITTQMVSKYKMKIVTCQEIEFEGMDGDDLEKIAHERLIEYRNQHGYPQTAIQAQKEQQYKQSIHHEIKADIHEARNSGHNQEEIMHKILAAKEKASNVLKQYTKNKKK